MQITIPAKTLQALVRDFKPIAGRSRVLPILQHVKLEAQGDRLHMLASDMELTITGSEPCTVTQPGAATVDFALLGQLVGKLTGDVTLTTSNLDTIMKAGRSKYTLRGLPPVEFPAIPTPPASGGVTLATKTLLEAITGTVYCADDSQPNEFKGAVSFTLAGKTLTFMAMDGFRLARWRDDAPEGNFAQVVPKRGLAEISRIMRDSSAEAATLYNLGTSVGFHFGDRYVTSRTLDQVYPNLEAALPTRFDWTVDVPRQVFLDALERALIIANSLEAKLMNLTFSDGEMTMVAGSANLTEGVEVLPIAWDGAALEVRLNGGFLKDVLRFMPGENLTISMNGPIQPVKVTSADDPRYLAVMMPMNKA